MASQHYYDFCNTPVYKRPVAWQKAKLAELELAVKVGDNGEGLHVSADAYYDRKDAVRRHRAAMANTTENKIDPMGFWYSRQSN